MSDPRTETFERLKLITHEIVYDALAQQHSQTIIIVPHARFLRELSNQLVNDLNVYGEVIEYASTMGIRTAGWQSVFILSAPSVFAIKGRSPTAVYLPATDGMSSSQKSVLRTIERDYLACYGNRDKVKIVRNY